MIPQTCKYKGRRFECGLSISCVLAGGKPVDSCSGGMIWSCCVDKDLHQESTAVGLVQNASESRILKCDLPYLLTRRYKIFNFFHLLRQTHFKCVCTTPCHQHKCHTVFLKFKKEQSLFTNVAQKSNDVLLGQEWYSLFALKYGCCN